jgi:dCMP deaminase
MNWTEYFRQIAHTVKLKSKDASTQIGAVIVGPDHEIVSTGYNSFPRGIDDTKPERQLRPEKYFWMIHAEANSVVNAARIGVSTKGCTMYLTCEIPCADCARTIINAGITTIYCEPIQPQRMIWQEHIKRSTMMFKEAGVEIRYYEQNIHTITPMKHLLEDI